MTQGFNRGRKLHVLPAKELDSTNRKMMEVYKEELRVIEVPFEGKTMDRAIAYVNHRSLYGEESFCCPVELTEVNVGEILEPAKSLADFKTRPELRRMLRPDSLVSLSKSVTALIQEQLEFHAALNKLLRVMQRDFQDYPAALDEREEKLLIETCAMYGLSADYIRNLQSINEGLASTANLMTDLWKLIKQKSN